MAGCRTVAEQTFRGRLHASMAWGCGYGGRGHLLRAWLAQSLERSMLVMADTARCHGSCRLCIICAELFAPCCSHYGKAASAACVGCSRRRRP